LSTNLFETDEALAWYVDVMIPVPITGLFTYRIPDELVHIIKPGCRVMVPFGKRKLYTAVVRKVHNNAPEGYQIHYIQELLDEEPLISDALLTYWDWLASYYMCPPGEVMNAALPAGLKIQSGTFVSLNPEIFWPDDQLSETEMVLLGHIEKKDKVSISDLESLVRSRSSLVKMIKNLYQQDLIILTEDLMGAYKPKTETYVKLSETFKNSDVAKEQIAILSKRAKKQYSLLLLLLSSPDFELNKKFLVHEKNVSPTTVSAMKKKGLLTEISKEVSRINMRVEEVLGIEPLVDFQQKALEQIRESWKEKQMVLLKAPTAGGKTHIYAHLIQEELEAGRQVALMLPEIALTEQLVMRLEKYFGDKMLVNHARFGKEAKTEVWHKINSGDPVLVVGPRSVALLPFKNPGLFIVDEEHESTFKQFDKWPRYHGRDALIKLASFTGAKVLLGSATPSIESYYYGLSGRWGLVSYDERFSNATQTRVQVVNLSSDKKLQGKRTFLTKTLDEAIRTTLANNQQIILFQNRKGYVPMLECGVCHWTPKCLNCDISLTYYKYSNNLRCHYCGYSTPVVSKCGACDSVDMRVWGFGTERIVEEIQLKYPGVNVSRFDQDSARGKDAYLKILADFEEKRVDILVGTQLVIKGIDFGNVGLCAVINADQLLNFPDYRAEERTFQMLVQLAGRAGRRGDYGKIIVQTGTPKHPLFDFLKDYDYDEFAEKQLAIRKQFNYPPFSRLIKITVQHKDELMAVKASELLSYTYKKYLGNKILGPEQPFVGRIKNYYLRNIMVKLDPGKDPITKIKKWIEETSSKALSENGFKGVRLVFDVDAF
jgi:primosomal protein N' (replication factor Y) (superfamily II helicase)